MKTLPRTPRERLEACLSGRLLDRPPVALWRHFPVDDQTPDGLAAATIEFQITGSGTSSRAVVEYAPLTW